MFIFQCDEHKPIDLYLLGHPVTEQVFMRIPYMPASIMTCGSGSVTIAAQDAFVPSVVRYFPLFPVWVGRALTVPHVTLVPSVVRYFPEFDVCAGRIALAAPAWVVAPVPP